MLRNVLIVDDDLNFLDSMRRTLRQKQEEWDISFSSNALTGLDILKDKGPTVVVTDWNMPRMDGMEFCRHIREREDKTELQNCYIILLTGNLGVEKAVEALEQGADDFLNKPCDPRELIARINVGFRIIELQDDLRRANQQLEVFARSMVE
jgi:DNA-binding response OmpR family regulator